MAGVKEEGLSKDEETMADQTWEATKKALGPARTLSMDKETAFKMGFTMAHRIHKENHARLLGRGGGAVVKKVVVVMSKEKKQ